MASVCRKDIEIFLSQKITNLSKRQWEEEEGRREEEIMMKLCCDKHQLLTVYLQVDRITTFACDSH